MKIKFIIVLTFAKRIRVCSVDPEATFVKAQAASNWLFASWSWFKTATSGGIAPEAITSSIGGFFSVK